MKVFLTDQVFPSTDTERAILRDVGATLDILDDPSPESIRTNAKDADALLTTYAPLDAETLSALTSCRVVSRYGIGVDNIDLEAAKKNGTIVTNVPDYCVDEVADHTFALLLSAVRKVPKGNAIVHSGGWGIAELRPVRRLRGMKLGMIGFGHIGRAVATRASSFGLKVTVFDPYVSEGALEEAGARRADSLEALLEPSDIITIHAPLTPETRGLIDSHAIAHMKQGAVVLNTSRGPIVRTDAVIDGLRSGKLAAAGLDVFEAEPPDSSHLTLDNLIATPHAAFYSEDAIAESQRKAASCVAAVLRGEEPPYRVA